MRACSARRGGCLSGAAALAILAALGCGATRRSPQDVTRAPATTSTAAATPPPAAVRRHPSGNLRVVSTASLPAPIQLPGVGSDGHNVVAVGGLDAADS